jgi:acetyltransferase
VTLTGARGDTRTFRATVVEKGLHRRTKAVIIAVAPWSPDTVEIIVRPALKRWKRSWSAHRERSYFDAADLAANTVAELLRGRSDTSQVWPRLHALADGTRVWVKPLRSEDRESYLRALAALSPTTIALRYGRPRSSLSDHEVDDFLDNGRDGREALAALTADGQTIIGIARMARAGTEPDTAEVAVVVADEWQRRGVGHLLTTDLEECAMAAGYRHLYATSNLDNAGIGVLLRHHGFHATSASLGVMEWSAQLA